MHTKDPWQRDLLSEARFPHSPPRALLTLIQVLLSDPPAPWLLWRKQVSVLMKSATAAPTG